MQKLKIILIVTFSLFQGLSAQALLSVNSLYPLRYINPNAGFCFDLSYERRPYCSVSFGASIQFNKEILAYQSLDDKGHNEYYQFFRTQGLRLYLKRYTKPDSASIRGFYTGMFMDVMHAERKEIRMLDGSRVYMHRIAQGMLAGFGFMLGRLIPARKFVLEPQAGIGLAVLSPELYINDKMINHHDLRDYDKRRMLLSPSFISLKLGYTF